MKRILLAFLFMLVPLSSAEAGEKLSDYQTLLMFYKEEDLVVSPTRYLKSITQVAENITVVSARDIEMMNAHTIHDIFNNVTGVHIDMRGSSPAASMSGIQGSDARQVMVVIDGVTLNNLANSVAYLATFPVQNIKRIEIIKGPASSAWGSSIGGVINIITKDTGVFDQPEGTLYGSYSERRSYDGRIEVAGKKEKLSYYVSGGSLSSQGLIPLHGHVITNAYGKVQLEATEDLTLQVSGGVNRGQVRYGSYLLNKAYRSETINGFATLNADYAINDSSNLDVSLRWMKENFDQETTTISTGAASPYVAKELTNGASAKYSWKDDTHAVVLGGDIDDRGVHSESSTDAYYQGRKTWDIFMNDTMTFGKFTVVPGVRYDSIVSSKSSFTSPSLGVTYLLNEGTLLRVYAAKGFNLPPYANMFVTNATFDSNPSLQVEKTTSYQVGIETTALQYLWLKLSLFQNNITDAMDSVKVGAKYQYQNVGRYRKQGVEFEMKTVPWNDFTLGSGYIYNDATNVDTNVPIYNIVKHELDVAVEYDDHEMWRGRLFGHYVWWDETVGSTSGFPGRYNTMIWDLNLIRKFYDSDAGVVEGFLTGRNLLGDSQYGFSYFQNAGKSLEIGIRIHY